MLSRWTSLSFPAWLDGDLEAIRRLIRDELPAPLQPFMQGLGYDLPENEDLPLRPFLLLAVSRHYGSSGDRPVRLAAAVQMIHLASLLHDRLGQAGGPAAADAGAPDPAEEITAHRRESTDILLGDYLFARSSHLVVEDGDERIIQDMIRTSAESAEAKARIVSLDESGAADRPRSCFEACADKLSLLLSLSLRTGGLLGGGSPDELQALSECGRSLGRALRIFEDLRFWMRPPGEEPSAQAEGPLTHPLLALWEKEGREAWELARRGLSSPHECGSTLRTLRDRLLGGGYLDASARKAREEAESAAERLEALAGTPERHLLQETARRVVER